MTPRKKIIISEENTLSDIVNDKNDINEGNKKTDNILRKRILPVIPLKDVVIYPYMLYPVLAAESPL